jgi:hypothetical protein
MMHIDRQTMFFSLSLSFLLDCLFSSFLAFCLSLARSNDNNHHQYSLSPCSIKSYEKNTLYDHSSIVPLHPFLTFVRLLSLLYTQLTITKTAAVVVVVAGPMIIGN